MSTGIETERKFVLAKGQELPGLEGLARPGQSWRFELDAVYYDTPDFRLYHAGLELRRRTGGVDAGWQLKLPTDHPDDRVEMLLPLTEPRLPLALREQITATVEHEPLTPVAELRTHRHQVELCDPDGTVLALVCTDRVTATVAGRRHEWSEAEVELVNGTRHFLDQVEARLRAAGVPRSPSPSKFAQAVGELALRAEQRADPPEAGAVVLAYVGRQLGLLQALEGDVIADGFDAVHRSRVATRRLRSCLRTYADVFRGQSVRNLTDELRWHGEQLGAPRDAEVLRDRLAADLAELAPSSRVRLTELVRDLLDERHARAHADLVTGLGSERYWRLHAALEQLLAEPPLDRTAGDPAGLVLPGLLTRAVHRVRRLAAHAEARPDDLTRWHSVRKAAKAVRYGAEVLVPVLGAQAEAQVATWTELTTLFGEVQDAVITGQLIAELWLAGQDAGLASAPFDELRHRQDRALHGALTAGRAALAAAVS